MSKVWQRGRIGKFFEKILQKWQRYDWINKYSMCFRSLLINAITKILRLIDRIRNFVIRIYPVNTSIFSAGDNICVVNKNVQIIRKNKPSLGKQRGFQPCLPHSSTSPYQSHTSNVTSSAYMSIRQSFHCHSTSWTKPKNQTHLKRFLLAAARLRRSSDM